MEARALLRQFREISHAALRDGCSEANLQAVAHLIDGMRVVARTDQERAILDRARASVAAASAEQDTEKRDAHCSMAAQFCEALCALLALRLEK